MDSLYTRKLMLVDLCSQWMALSLLSDKVKYVLRSGRCNGARPFGCGVCDTPSESLEEARMENDGRVRKRLIEMRRMVRREPRVIGAMLWLDERLARRL